MVAKLSLSVFDSDSIAEMNNVIHENRIDYMTLLRLNLRPKDHHMIHYEMAIKDNGPLKYTSSMRAESKHQDFIKYTRNTKNRINICYSVAKKQGYQFANFLLNHSPNILNKISESIPYNIELSSSIKDFIQNENLGDNYISGKFN